MAMTMHVDIVSAENEIFSGQATMLVAPAQMGEVGIMPRHSPFISKLKPGEVRVDTPDGEGHYFYVSSGIIEVQPNVVTVLADTAMRAKDLDEAAAREAVEMAEKAMTDKQADIDYAKAQSQLAEAIAQLRALENLRKRTRG
ncbi:MAG: F0F1 ATP synthase subunit epsilon [Gammaproteobacteria bacterium]|nr:F0F1 ATP synthase subunit epsilon [Gammaproteobacteria bacterium]MCP5138209.1 F0F1 ATP synthase subunit epsilon [Gammaproteobacteria bacterium]